MTKVYATAFVLHVRRSVIEPILSVELGSEYSLLSDK